ncbi:hypothetical protein CDCA_CDCA02G0562 [Cyanidium caldarium]|uniref:Origin recognition complex subunit 4 C-terminal domain-containing protein n=1 Tax=Cyanidium caldarium TaxID=2771 RepID=A0AAV9IQ96_CYACA|nr:hypothetical protein CDCA_CDCA02G0562 [Cyanidium caldarium]
MVRKRRADERGAKEDGTKTHRMAAAQPPPTASAIASILARLESIPAPDGVPLTPDGDAVCETLGQLLESSLSPDVHQRQHALHSALVLGPPSGGKSAVVLTALQRLARRLRRPPACVYLCGSMHGADELAAYRAIAAQLQAALPTPMAADGAVDAHSLVDCLGIIQRCLRRLGVVLAAATATEADAASVDEPVSAYGAVFVLDAFDEFAASAPSSASPVVSRPQQQQLLYNLLNFFSSDSSPPGFVIGMTRRVDTLDLLEKRVRSRFSQKVLYAMAPANVEEVVQHVRQRLDVDGSGSDPGAAVARRVLAALEGDAAVHALAQSQWRDRRQVKPFLRAVALAIGSTHRQGMTDAASVAHCLRDALTLVHRADERAQALRSVSALELGLLVAHHRLVQVQKLDAPCFQQVHREYQTHRFHAAVADAAPRAHPSTALPPAVALRAFQRLLDRELLAAHDHHHHRHSTHLPKSQQPVVQLVAGHELVQALQTHPAASATLQRWGLSWLE